MRWAYLLRNRRLIISNEMGATCSTLDGIKIKKLSSGGDIRCRGEYDEDWNDIMANFLETFEFTNNKADSVKSKEIEGWIGKMKEISYSKFCVQMKKYCVPNGKTIELCRKKIKKQAISSMD